MVTCCICVRAENPLPLGMTLMHFFSVKNLKLLKTFPVSEELIGNFSLLFLVVNALLFA